MNAKKCRYCGTSMPSDFRICPYCGKRQPMSVGFLILLLAIISAAAGAYLLFHDSGNEVKTPETSIEVPAEQADENEAPGEEQHPNIIEEGKGTADEEQKRAEEQRLARERAENERRLREEAARIKAEREKFEREQAEKRRRAKEEAMRKKAAEDQMSIETVPVGEGNDSTPDSEEGSREVETLPEEKPAANGLPVMPQPASTTTEQQ